MEDNLISKKELLEITGISYGQLYRWKRKSIIPEEWFIKKSSYTGQETYFPREKILERIEKIKNLKDEISLDELAEIFSKTPANVEITKGDIEIMIGVSKCVVDIYEEINKECGKYNFNGALIIYILEQLLKSGEITIDEGKDLCRIMSNLDEVPHKYKIILLRKLGISIWVTGFINGDIEVDESTKIIIDLYSDKYIEELKLKLGNINL